MMRTNANAELIGIVMDIAATDIQKLVRKASDQMTTYANLNVSDPGRISQRLKNFVDKHSINKRDVPEMKRIIAFYYGAHMSSGKHNLKMTLKFRLDWFTANKYNVYINEEVWNMFDPIDLDLINYLFDQGLEVEYELTIYEATLQRMLNKYSKDFAEDMKWNIPLSKKGLRNLRMWGLQHDFNLKESEIKYIFKYKYKDPFRKPSPEELSALKSKQMSVMK